MKKILIVDDNKYINIILSLLFEESGFESLVAKDSETALKNIKSDKPSLVVLDKKLPDCDGISLLEKIKLHDPDLPVIMISAYTDLEYSELAIKTGAYAFVSKPFNNKEMIGLIKKALSV